MKPNKHRAGSDDRRFASLAPLARKTPATDSAIAEIARLTAELTVPQGTIHVISDIHGEDKKLRHVINNASGTLRPLVEGLLKGQMPAEGLQQFLALVFYPAEVVAMLEAQLRTAQAQKQFAMKALRALFAIVRALAARRPLQQAVRLFPRQYRELLAEILHEPSSDREREYVEAIVHECLYSICMHGPGVQTVSYTEVVVSPTELTMRYQAAAPCRRCPAVAKSSSR
jgi:fructose-1,6-bisphosphatase-3